MNPAAPSPSADSFSRWWKSSKYTQVVYPESQWEQMARDAWSAAISAPAAAVGGGCQHCGKDMVVTACASCGEPAAPVGGFVVDGIGLVDIFDAGYQWRNMTDNGHVYDGRDVGRTLLATIFDGWGIDAGAVDGMATKDRAMVQARAEINRALSARAASPAAQPSANGGVRVDDFCEECGGSGTKYTDTNFVDCPACAATAAGLVEWRWVDEKGRAMTNWKQSDPPPMREVSDMKGTMRVEIREAAIGREVVK